MLEGIGSSERARRAICCDVCTEGVPYPWLAVLGHSSTTSRKRRPVKHNLTKSDKEVLTKRLQDERDKIIQQHPAFRMIGRNFVLSDSGIAEICKDAKFVCTSSDLPLYCIRPEFRDRIFNVVVEMVGSIPPPKRKRRV